MNKKHWCISWYVRQLARFHCHWSTLCSPWDDCGLHSCFVCGCLVGWLLTPELCPYCMCGTSWFEYPCQAQRCRTICLLYKHWAHAMEAWCAFDLIPISRARRLLGRLSRFSGTWWSLRAITSLSMLFAQSHFDWNPCTPYWSTGTGLVFLQYTDVVTPFCIFYIFAEAFHLPCSGGYTLLLSRNLIDGFLYNSELMEKDLLCIHALFRLTRFIYVQILYKHSFECMTL